MGDTITQGLGVGMAQSLVSSVGPAGHAGTATYFTADCSHFTFFFTRQLALRATLGFAFQTSGNDYCRAHPQACPDVSEIPLSATATLLWSFDVGHGQD